MSSLTALGAFAGAPDGGAAADGGGGGGAAPALVGGAESAGGGGAGCPGSEGRLPAAAAAAAIWLSRLWCASACRQVKAGNNINTLNTSNRGWEQNGY